MVVATAIAVLVGGHGFAAVFARLVITGMAGRAKGGVSGIVPGNRFAIAGVAGFTGQRHSMVTRIVARGMHIFDSRLPRGGGMTEIALF